LPRYQAYLLSNFASKVHQSLPNTEMVKSKDIIKGIYETMSYYRSLGTDKSLFKVSDMVRVMDEK